MKKKLRADAADDADEPSSAPHLSTRRDRAQPLAMYTCKATGVAHMSSSFSASDDRLAAGSPQVLIGNWDLHVLDAGARLRASLESATLKPTVLGARQAARLALLGVLSITAHDFKNIPCYISRPAQPALIALLVAALVVMLLLGISDVASVHHRWMASSREVSLATRGAVPRVTARRVHMMGLLAVLAWAPGARASAVVSPALPIPVAPSYKHRHHPARRLFGGFAHSHQPHEHYHQPTAYGSHQHHPHHPHNPAGAAASPPRAPSPPYAPPLLVPVQTPAGAVLVSDVTQLGNALSQTTTTHTVLLPGVYRLTSTIQAKRSDDNRVVKCWHRNNGLEIMRSMKIEAAVPGTVVLSVDYRDLQRVMCIFPRPGDVVELIGLNFTGGTRAGALFVSEGMVTMTDCAVYGNSQPNWNNLPQYYASGLLITGDLAAAVLPTKSHLAPSAV